MKRILVVLTCLLMVVACGHKTTTSTKRGSSGKTLEVLLVADKETYSGDTKNLIDSLFRRPQAGMPQIEPIFDLVNIPVSSFRNTEMFQVHRNVIICDIKPKQSLFPYRPTCRASGCFRFCRNRPQQVRRTAQKIRETHHRGHLRHRTSQNVQCLQSHRRRRNS